MSKYSIKFGLIFFCVAISILTQGCGSNSGGTASACGTDSCGLCPSEQTGVRVCSFVYTPTVSESVKLINYTTSNVNLNGYSIWDQNAYDNGSGQKTLVSSDVISGNGGTLTFTGLPFGINDTNETIYLKNASAATIDQRSN